MEKRSYLNSLYPRTASVSNSRNETSSIQFQVRRTSNPRSRNTRATTKRGRRQADGATKKISRPGFYRASTKEKRRREEKKGSEGKARGKISNLHETRCKADWKNNRSVFYARATAPAVVKGGKKNRGFPFITRGKEGRKRAKRREVTTAPRPFIRSSSFKLPLCTLVFLLFLFLFPNSSKVRETRVNIVLFGRVLKVSFLCSVSMVRVKKRGPLVTVLWNNGGNERECFRWCCC